MRTFLLSYNRTFLKSRDMAGCAVGGAEFTTKITNGTRIGFCADLRGIRADDKQPQKNLRRGEEILLQAPSISGNISHSMRTANVVRRMLMQIGAMRHGNITRS